jgi:dTDP-4-dehydrorhamnose reductase
LERPVLLLGSTGQIGRLLATGLDQLGRVVCAARGDADLERPDVLRALVRRLEPGLVVNAAAYTAVDDAEHDRERCARINAEAPGVLAEEAATLGAPIVHFSTNYVFDGQADQPYDEDAPTAPLSTYGDTKRRGEIAVADATRAHLIFRTAAVYGWTGRNFLRRILALAHEREELQVVDDQFVAPTPARVVADATITALRVLLATSEGARPYGTYHMTSSGGTSWFGFAERILALDPQRMDQRVKRLRPTSSADFHAAALRPRNGLLSTDRAARAFGLVLPAWNDELRRMMASPEATLND